MNRKILTLVFGTLILFIWNAISWMALPFHNNSLHNIPDGVIQAELMKKEMPESGVYHFPGMPDMSSKEQMSQVEKRLEDGPRITMMVYKNEPTKLFDPITFLWSLLINFLTVVLILKVVDSIRDKEFKSILATTISIGLIAALLSDVSLMNWFMFPLDYTLISVFDKIIGLGLLGVLFAKFTYRGHKENT